MVPAWSHKPNDAGSSPAPATKCSSGERIRRPWSVVDATDGYSAVGKKASEQDVVTMIAAREGSNPSLSTIAPLA